MPAATGTTLDDAITRAVKNAGVLLYVSVEGGMNMSATRVLLLWLSLFVSLALTSVPIHAADTATKGVTSAVAAPVVATAATPVAKSSTEPALDFFGDKPIAEAELVHVPPPKPEWMTVGGPIALMLFFFALIYAVYKLIPFRETPIHFDLHDLPVAAQRGIGMAVILFGFAFLFGAAQVHYQLGMHDSTEAYFQQMSVGKLITMTHAHMFGFTTSFLHHRHSVFTALSIVCGSINGYFRWASLHRSATSSLGGVSNSSRQTSSSLRGCVDSFS